MLIMQKDWYGNTETSQSFKQSGEICNACHCSHCQTRWRLVSGFHEVRLVQQYCLLGGNVLCMNNLDECLRAYDWCVGRKLESHQRDSRQEKTTGIWKRTRFFFFATINHLQIKLSWQTSLNLARAEKALYRFSSMIVSSFIFFCQWAQC